MLKWGKKHLPNWDPARIEQWFRNRKYRELREKKSRLFLTDDLYSESDLNCSHSSDCGSDVEFSSKDYETENEDLTTEIDIETVSDSETHNAKRRVEIEDIPIVQETSDVTQSLSGRNPNCPMKLKARELYFENKKLRDMVERLEKRLKTLKSQGQQPSASFPSAGVKPEVLDLNED